MKDTIKTEISPHLQTYSYGRALLTSKLVGVTPLILYRLKTGCHGVARQWRELPIRYLDVPYNWRSVYHHFNNRHRAMVQRWLMASCLDPGRGRPNDVFNIEEHFYDLLTVMHVASIRTDGLFLNAGHADAGFNTKKLRSLCFENDIMPTFT